MMDIRSWTRTAVAGLILLLGACTEDDPQVMGGGTGSGGPLVLKAETVLPPGQSGLWNASGQLQGSATGDPADYGSHVDDQRELYWSFAAKPGALRGKPGTAVVPKGGVEIYRDDYGVPIVYAPNVRDLWVGVGYAVGQDRLFLMDAVRRTGAGTLAELTGCGDVDADIQQRVLTYSADEYAAMFDALSQDSKDMIDGYVEGANLARAWALADPPNRLPAEYALLQTTPTVFTRNDVLAAGVYITRFVAAEGGNEFLNIQMLRQLKAEYGNDAEAIKAFQDMTWLEDRKAVTSVPAPAEFSNHAVPAGGRDAVFAELAEWAMALPDTVWKGPGTGHAAPPMDCELLGGGIGLPAGGLGAGPPKLTKKAAQRRLALAKLREGLAGLRRKPTGASFAFAVGRERTRDGGALLISAPQLGYSYPLLLVEYEIHGAGYDARGVSVPILPTVGIGYNADLAWGLTTGYSKTIDSYIETVCSTAQQAASTCNADEYFHQGSWKDMSCRTETVNYRPSSQGLPFGPPALSTAVPVCRTVHGPIVARDDTAGLARSVEYGMFGREIETIEGIRLWNQARSLAEFQAGMAKVTWNENTTVATKDGDIAFYHPGLHRRRHAETDQRLPIPGEGALDSGPPLAFAETPQSVNPAQGYLANWNNKPALGWLDGEGMGSTSRPGGPGQRVTNILDKLATRSDWTFADLLEIDRHAGTTDPRARQYLPLIVSLRTTATGLTDLQRAALDLMIAWDRKHYDASIDIADETKQQDSAGATLFHEYVVALRNELFGGLKDNIIDPGTPDADPNNPTPESGLTVYGRVAGVGSHLFDQSVMDNLVVRVLDPSSSSLALRRDYTGGRTRNAVMLAALDDMLASIAGVPLECDTSTPAALAECRRVHPRSQICSLSGVVGPGSDTVPGTSCVTMPYQDRGSWVHRVGFEAD